MNDTPAKTRGLMGLFRRSEAPAQPAPPELAEETAAAVPQSTVPDPEPPKKQGWFQRLKAGLTKTSARLSEDIAGIFTRSMSLW